MRASGQISGPLAVIQPGKAGHFRPLHNLRAAREQPIVDN